MGLSCRLEDALFSVVMMGLRLSPFRRFFCPLLFAARAAVVATFLAWLMAAFLRSVPFIMAKAAALAASNLLGWTATGPFAGPVSDRGGIVKVVGELTCWNGMRDAVGFGRAVRPQLADSGLVWVLLALDAVTEEAGTGAVVGVRFVDLAEDLAHSVASDTGPLWDATRANCVKLFRTAFSYYLGLSQHQSVSTAISYLTLHSLAGRTD